MGASFLGIELIHMLILAEKVSLIKSGSTVGIMA
jgi:hypothetical protein